MNREKTIYNRIIKRILDVICSFMAIVFLSIIYLPICVVIKVQVKVRFSLSKRESEKIKNILIYLNSEQ